MRKTYQIERGVTVENGKTVVISTRLNEAYGYCTGFFLVNTDGVATTLDGVTLGLTIGDREVLPLGCDAGLFEVTTTLTPEEAHYDFKEDGIPARSSEAQLTLSFDRSDGTASRTVNVYYILENR